MCWLVFVGGCCSLVFDVRCHMCAVCRVMFAVCHVIVVWCALWFVVVCRLMAVACCRSLFAVRCLLYVLLLVVCCLLRVVSYRLFVVY